MFKRNKENQKWAKFFVWQKWRNFPMMTKILSDIVLSDKESKKTPPTSKSSSNSWSISWVIVNNWLTQEWLSLHLDWFGINISCEWGVLKSYSKRLVRKWVFNFHTLFISFPLTRYNASFFIFRRKFMLI